MSSSLSSCIPRALPSLSTSLSISSKQKQTQNYKQKKTITKGGLKPSDFLSPKHFSLAIVQVGAVLSTTAQPSLAVTLADDGDDLTWLLIQAAISGFLYFIVCPPIIMNWLRIRWYKRNMWEMFLQFMFIFLFYPGVLLWTPLLNFRKLPRDPSMKYPWSTPENPSQIRTIYRKYPWAQPEDYE